MTTRTSTLRALADIITKNVDAIEALSSASGISHPSIDNIYDPDSASEQFTLNSDVLTASILATSAASQLIATLKLPGLTLLDRANAFHIPSALRVASEACVVEMLREAGPQGLDVKELAARSNTQPVILGRALRLLATHYVFKEVAPNVFANNRISSMLDTNKDSSKVLEILKIKTQQTLPGAVSNVQGEKYLETSGVQALVEQCTDEVFKSSAYLPDVIIANDFSKTPFQRAMQFDGTLWEFLEKNPGYLQRIQMALVAWKKLQPQQALFTGFDWASLPKNALLVDVGGGNGSESLEIAKKAPHIKIIIQDREQTIQQVALPTWQGNSEQMAMLETKQVSLEAQDFFDNQPAHVAGKAAVFFLRFITHDWPTPECIKILKQLYAAASSTTKLMLVDQLVPYACPTPAIEGLKPTIEVPHPLLANLGEANSDVYTTDFTMAALLNAQERTIGEFREIVEAGGWKLDKVYQTVGSSLCQLLCSKV